MYFLQHLQHEVLVRLERETNIVRQFSRLSVLRPRKHYLALACKQKSVFLRSQMLFHLIVTHGMMLAIPSVSESSFFGLLAFAEDHVVRLDPWTILAKGREGDSVDSLVEEAGKTL